MIKALKRAEEITDNLVVLLLFAEKHAIRSGERKYCLTTTAKQTNKTKKFKTEMYFSVLETIITSLADNY